MVNWIKKYFPIAKKYAIIIFGTFISATAISLFLAPNKITSGGISGVATVVHYLWHFPIGVSALFLNIPLFIIGIRYEGRNFGIKSIYATVLMSLFIDLLSGFAPVTDDIFLAAVFGGVLMGTGLGLVFISEATTGGTDIIAKLIQRVVRHLQLGKLILFIDILIIVLATVVFGDYKIGLYSAISLYASTHMIDVIIDGGKFAKTVFIISDNYSEIADGIKNELKRGVTGLIGKGMYSGNNKTILMCTLKRNEVPKLKDLVKEKDRFAFVILTDVREVLGEGFIYSREEKKI
ncbi:MAG: YitT family protein [Clostridiaceae bacterium]|jgi:uncharacterized membrane-anchored protein YitT (DUF2179 family)|nr:YitT family protein [Clostridiaceae bacterium]